MPRVNLSKKLRFEILKRDEFKCRYCGMGQGDGATLHVDHVIPVAMGGHNDPDNLATSCADCNLGKAARLISDPKLIGIDFAARKKVFEAANASLDRYQDYLREKTAFEERLVATITEPWHGHLIEKYLPGKHELLRSITMFLEQLPPDAVRHAVDVTISAFNTRRVDRAATFRYFCGICHSKIRGE